MKYCIGNSGIALLVRLFLATMLVFAVQKVFFLLMTLQEGTSAHDFLQVVLHGLKLDSAVTAYTLILPFLLLAVMEFLPMPYGRKDELQRRFLKIYYAVVVTIVAVIIVADTALYPFWHFKIDTSVFIYTDKPKDAMASVSTGFIVNQLLRAAVWAWFSGRLLFLAIGRPSSDTGTKVPSTPWKRARAVTLYAAVCAVLVLMIRGGVGKGTNNVSEAYYSDNQYLNHAAVNPVFNMLYSIGKLEDFASEAQYFSEEECKRIIEGIYNTETVTEDTLLTTARPNILLVIWEGADWYLAGEMKAMPNLVALAEEGADFTACHANSFRTDRGQLSLLAGWPAIPKTSLMKIPEKCDNMPALPRTLLRNGYATTFWYGGDISFASTGGYMHQAGFQKTVSDKDFPRKDIATAWGVYDGTLFDKAYEGIAQDFRAHPDRPFFHTVMTLSSHEPWTVPVRSMADDRLNAFHYTDRCLGNFISRLRQSPMWDNLLVVITSDHGIPFGDNAALHDHDVTHIPMIWTGGAVARKVKIDKLMNQADLPATLLGQMGIAHRDFIFSRDVTSRTYVYPNAFHTYNSGITFVDSTGRTTFDLEGERSVAGHDSVRERKAKALLQNLYKKTSEL
ncbi:MAG: LTA synthase family protein [Bacteroidales bacterium]|nr:LTA synthase family protein [Bacteroidales bacterium]MCM1146532.1 LTA synthase family protein [Bacteroidales bacterium]MCM1205924.1 LTA synthase family protein [Bacillota bacterium]MCM1510198.1 LTA synthase family protein [Clostridium sp.]